MKKKTFVKKIKSDPDLMPEVEEFVMRHAAGCGFNDEQLNRLALSVAEAVSNSIVHGNKLDVNKNVTVVVFWDDEYFTVSFKDEGTGFNPQNVPNPTFPENILKDHGRGIHIMKSFVDNVEYNFSDEGTELILKVKR
ncbi:MAG: ATP-binding protein [Chlorobi bacterium]|nr:ATP-binding protein [Chlorobiota bacterium]